MVATFATTNEIINAELLCTLLSRRAVSPRKEITVFTVNPVNESFCIPATGWYAIGAAPHKFAVSLRRNDITPLRHPRVFTLVYAFMHKGEGEADGEKGRGGGGERRISREWAGRDNERAADGAGLIISRNT